MRNKPVETPYVSPKATRASKTVVPDTQIPDTEPTLPCAKWVQEWPKKPIPWNNVGGVYKLQQDSVRLEVFSKTLDHSTRLPIYGFAVYGMFGLLHMEPTFSFDIKDAQQAAILSIEWINNGKQGLHPYPDPVFRPAATKPPPRPRPAAPVQPRPHLILPEPIVVTFDDDDMMAEYKGDDYEDEDFVDDEQGDEE